MGSTRSRAGLCSLMAERSGTTLAGFRLAQPLTLPSALLGGLAVVKSNARDGVRVFGGSFRSLGGVISNNGGQGVSVFNSGTAILVTGTVVASNAMNGVLVEDGT